MKKLLMLLTLLQAATSFAACSSDTDGNSQPDKAAGESSVRTLVVYYSYTNNVETIVNDLKEQIECDVLEIEPAEKGLKYEANNYAIGTEQLNKINANPDDLSSYPAIDPVSVNLADYDCVIIGTPLWWSQMATPMQSFLFQYGQQMAGKHIGLIVSSASSGISRVSSRARELIPNGQFFSQDLWVRSSQTSSCHSLIAQWLQDVDYNALIPNTNNDMPKLYITVGETEMTATLVDNSSTRALVERLQQGDVTYEAHDYGNFEKVGELGFTLPRNDEDITTQPGDLILYLGTRLCIYYDTNTWDFTRMGKIDGLSQQQLKDILGTGNITVRLSLTSKDATAISNVRQSGNATDKAYRLNGQIAKASDKGIMITDGKKHIVR